MNENKYSFETCLDKLIDRSWQEGAVLWHTNHANKFDSEKKQVTNKILRILDLDEFEILGNGEHAFALGDRSKGIMIRVGKGCQRPDEPEVIKPLMSFVVDSSVFSVTKLLNTEDVTKKHVLSVKHKLGSKGWNFNEARESNVGLLDDGTPVVLDPENISYNSNYTDNTDNRRNPDAKFLKQKESHFLGDGYLKLRQDRWYIEQEIFSGNNPFKNKYEWNFEKHYQGIDERYVPGSDFMKDAERRIEEVLKVHKASRLKSDVIKVDVIPKNGPDTGITMSGVADNARPSKDIELKNNKSDDQIGL